jgi:hypothetical protein
MVMFGCSFSNDATSSSHCLRSLAAVVGGSQFTVIVVGPLGSPAAGAELAGAGLDEVPVVAGALAGVDALAEVGPVVVLALLLQPAKVTMPATASSATNLWCFIERSLLGCRSGAGLAAAAHAGHEQRPRVRARSGTDSTARAFQRSEQT